MQPIKRFTLAHVSVKDIDWIIQVNLISDICKLGVFSENAPLTVSLHSSLTFPITAKLVGKNMKMFDLLDYIY